MMRTVRQQADSIVFFYAENVATILRFFMHFFQVIFFMAAVLRMKKELTVYVFLLQVNKGRSKYFIEW
ncbi:MAG TPA: hypothetical protein VL307_20170 [Chitinophagaceae bacterium]|nr:hypothetical protein [Chitinophagaceae bacterium]